MITIVKGYSYGLYNYVVGSEDQKLQFVHKVPSALDPTQLDTINGTTNEEVLMAMIDHCEFLYNKFPSTETLGAIYHMKAALDLLLARTRDRIARGVEGKHQA